MNPERIYTRRYPCGYCGADAGQPCRSKSGAVYPWHHRARWDLAWPALRATWAVEQLARELRIAQEERKHDDLDLGGNGEPCDCGDGDRCPFHRAAVALVEANVVLAQHEEACRG